MFDKVMYILMGVSILFIGILALAQMSWLGTLIGLLYIPVGISIVILPFTNDFPKKFY